MSTTPMTRDQYLGQLKRWGVNYRAYQSDWDTHERDDETGKAFGPVHGIMWHHTGSDSDDRSTLWNGRSDLPGPLCHVGIDIDGVVWLMSLGRANHAGLVDDDCLQHVVNEDYSGILVPNEANTDGNDALYGAEIMYSGSHAMSAKQYQSALKWTCAILEWHKWGSKSAVGHGELQPGKWDPGITSGKMTDMSKVRSDIQKTLDAGPGGTTMSDTTTPQTALVVWKTDFLKPAEGKATTTNPTWTAESLLKYAADQAAQANMRAAKLEAAFKAFAEQFLK